MDGTYFECRLDSKTRVISILILLSVIAGTVATVVVLILVAMSLSTDQRLARLVLFAAAGFAVIEFLGLAAVATFAPKGYWVGPDGITVVRRNGRKLVLAKGELASAEEAEPEVLKRSTRSCGGSFFGHWGRFKCSALGSFRGYWGNRESLVLVRDTSGRPIVLSPESRGYVVECVNELLGKGRRR
ncbi:MAG: hypothetical protein HZB26_22490 [Candidatus Hydrogenedentes bacterium]|nr:hypothetical protein [Candidatus Hydrogenedentota bacterium]